MGRAWARAYNKNQILSPRGGLGPKPNFFIYKEKSEPERKLSQTYSVTFSSPKSLSRPIPNWVFSTMVMKRERDL